MTSEGYISNGYLTVIKNNHQHNWIKEEFPSEVSLMYPTITYAES